MDSKRELLSTFDETNAMSEFSNRKECRFVHFTIIRHGESDMNTMRGRICGRSKNTQLTEKGRLQAEACGKRLKRIVGKFDEAYTSPLERAHETAEIALFAMDDKVQLVRSSNLEELSMGCWTGLSRDSVYIPGIIEDITREGPFHRAPGVDEDDVPGESQMDVEERFAAFMNEIIQKKEGRKDCAKVVIFTHGIAIRCFLRRILGAGPLAALHLDVANTSITEVEYRPYARYDYKSDLAGWHLIRMNDAAHLENL